MSSTATINDRDTLASWYAKRHFETDTGVERIHYLPHDAPPREIRFLEVNHLISETTNPEPLDFGVDVDNPEAYTLCVLDVTPSQWAAILNKEMALPAGWTLEGSQTFSRQ